MGLTYFMLQSLRNIYLKKKKKGKEVCSLCDTSDLLKEKYLVLFSEPSGCFGVPEMNYLFYRGAERLRMESGLHPATTVREQVCARRNLLSAYTREGETRMESGAQPQPYQAQDQL